MTPIFRRLFTSPLRTKVSQHGRQARLSLRPLEDRLAPATFTVTNLGDNGGVNPAAGAGTGTLRQAIVDANSAAGADAIVFQSGVTGTISINTQLSVTEAVTITGPGSASLTLSNVQAAGAASRVLLTTLATAGGVVAISGVTISGGNLTPAAAANRGAGINNTNANLQLTDVIVTNNKAVADGGGININAAAASLTLTNSKVTNNQATGAGYDGGGINVQAGSTITITNSTISGNTAADDGAGIYFFNGGTFVLTGSTVSGNTAGTGTAADGGGVYLFGASATIRNSTFSGNSAGRGGAIAVDSTGGTLTITNSTISGNTAASTGTNASGGITRTYAGTVSVESTVIAGNTGGVTGGNDVSIAGNALTANFSFIGNASGVTITGGNNQTGTTAAQLNPQITGLQDNGGPTFTRGPLPGSPLLNTGSNPAGLTTDQRGNARLQGSQVDIGSVEGAIAAPSAALTAANVTTGGATSYTFTVTYTAFSPALVDVSTLGTGDVTVAGPGAFSATPTFVMASPNTNAGTVVATYTFTAPGGSFDPTDNGTYTISLVANQVADTMGVKAPAGTLGTFSVSIPLVLTVTNANDTGAGSLRDAITQTNALTSTDTINFDPTFFATARTITLGSALPTISDSVTITGPGASFVTVTGAGAFRPFTVSGAGTLNVAISGMTITGGSSATGGALYNLDENVSLDRVVIAGNTSTGQGGAIYNRGAGTLRLVNSTISGNTAGGNGGGFYFYNGGSFLIQNSTISGNTTTAGLGGAGGYFYGTAATSVPTGFTPGTLVVQNSTIANNTTSNYGGGITTNAFTGTLLIQNTTISGNTSTSTTGKGGGLAVAGGTLTLQNSIVSGNNNTNAPDIFTYGATVANANFSAIGSATGFTLSATSGNNIAFGTDLKLGTLGNNGGPTQTFLPQAGSPLLDAGSNALIPTGVTTDQRGVNAARVYSTSPAPVVDIGSVEVQPLPPFITTTPGAITYTENAPAVVVDAGLTVADLDSTQLSGATVQILGVFGTNEVLAFTPVGGITGSYDPLLRLLTLSGVSSVANYQAALRSVTFIANGDNPTPGDRSITFRVTDSPTNYQSVAATRTVTVVAVNDPPTITGVTTPSQAVNDNATVSPFAGVTIDDPDNASITVTVAYTAANGVFTNLGGFTGSAGSYTFTGSPAAAQAAIRGLVFNPTNNQVAPGSTVTTTFTISASDAIAPAATNNQTTVVATSVNDIPVLGGITTAPQAVNDNATVHPFAAVTVTDPDVGQTQTITITYTAANGVFTTLGGFTGSAGNYTLSGVTPAAAQAAIRGLTFVPTNNQATPNTTVTSVFTIADSDGVAAATNNQTTVVATSINDVPTLGGITAAPQSITDKATANPFSGVTISDPDVNPITVTVSYTAANGSFSNLNGFTGSAGSYSFTGTAVAAQAAIHGLLFTPTENQVAPNLTVTTMFGVAVNDGFATPVTNGQTTVVATSVEDPPVLAGVTTTPQATNDDTPIAPFSGVTISDPDVNPITVTVGYTAANGSFSNLNGFTGGPGSYSFTGTPAAAQVAVDGLLFVPTQDQVLGGQTVTTVFTLAVDDGYVPPVTDGQTTVVATSVDGTPIIGGTASNQPVNDDATVSPFAAVTVSDTDSRMFAVTISYAAANGDFTAASLAGGGFAGSPGSYTVTVSAASPALATQAAQAAIRQLVFQPTTNQVAPGGTVTTVFTIDVSDFNTTGTNNSSSVVATSINDAPTLGGIMTGSQPVDDDATVSPFAGVTIADPDFSPTETVTITYTAANGVFTNLGGFTGSAGLYSFTGTPAAAQAAIRGLVFDPTENQATPNTTVTTAFMVSITDGLAPAVTDGQTTVVATSVNDVPALGGVTTAPQAVDDDATVSPFAGVTIADPDVNPVTVTVSYDPANGVLTSLGGFTGSAGSYTFTGSPAAAQAAIRGLVFDPTENQVAPNTTVTTTFTIAVDDGFAPAVTDGQTTVVATSVNDVPVIGGVTTATQAITDKGTSSPFAGVTIADPDVTPVTVTVTYTAANGTLTSLGGFTGSAGSYSFTGSPAGAQAALRGLVFVPTANQVTPNTTVTTAFGVTVDDGFAPAVTNGQTTVVATSVNDAPALGGITTAAQPVDDNAAVSPFAGVTIADPDVNPITVTVTYTAANGTFTSLGGFTGSAGSYTFTGSATAAQAAIRGLVFVPTNNQAAPNQTVTTTFGVAVNDGFAPPATNGQTTVVTTSVNDVPVIGGVNTGPQGTGDNASISPFAGVTVADPDTTPVTVTVTYTAANGTLSSLGGFAGSAGSYSFTGTPAAAQAALRGLVFVPTNNQVAPNTTVTTAFTLAVADGFAPPVTNGQTTVVATSVNDVPVIGGVNAASQAVNDKTTISPFAGVTITDPDTTPVTVTVSYAAANGTFASLGGFVGSAGSYSFTGTPAAALAALRGLVFVPTPDQATPNTAVTTAFTIGVDDGFAPAVTDGQTTVAAMSVNDAPTLGGVTTGAQAVNDNATISPFAGVTIADPDPSPVTITIAYAAANGSFANLGGFTGTAGNYTFTGRPAAAQAALRGLVFVPTANQAAPGTTVTTVFSLTVDDGFAPALRNTQTTVAATSVNELPVIGGVTPGPQATTDDTNVQPFATVTVSDVDDTMVTVSLTYPAADGSFTNLGGFTGRSGTYVFTGSTAAAQAALRGLVFQPTTNQVPEGGSVTTAFGLTVTDASGGVAKDDGTTVVATNPVPPVPPVPPVTLPPVVGAINQNGTRQFAVYSPETGTVAVYDGSRTAAYTVTAFAGQALPGGVRPAVADVNHDGVPDLIVATGPGVASQVQVFDGVTHQLTNTLNVFESSFTGGLFVAAGDVDGDGYADLAVSADTSGGSRVVVFSGRTSERLADFFGIDDPAFRGGARVALGDVNGDGLSDLVVAAGIGGGPRVAIFDGATVRPGRTPTRLVNDFFAFEPSLRNGAYVSAGDVTGDGKADLVFGGGPDGGPRVLVFDAAALLRDGRTLTPLADFYASDSDQRQGVRVVVKNYDGDARADVLVLTPTSAGVNLNVYHGGSADAGETLITYRQFETDDLSGIYVG